MFDLEDLRAFVEVAESGGLTPAAKRLNLSKSMVSRRLARLEAELETRLLSRNTRGVALTEAGSTFLAHAKRIGGEIEAACDALHAGDDVRGSLRIAAPLSFGATHLAPVLAELARRHPKLHVQAIYSDRYVDLIAERFDVAVRLGRLPDSTLVARRIAPVRAKMVASPGYIAAHGAPARPDEVSAHEALMQGSEVWRVLDHGKEVAFQPQGRFKSDSGQALTAAALAGLGVAMLPDFLTDPYVESGALVPIMTDYPVPEAGLYVVRPPPPGPPPRKIQALTDLMVEAFGTCP